MLACSAIQRLERVGASNAGGGGSTSGAAAFVWAALKEPEQLTVQTLCDAALWEAAVAFVAARPAFPLSDALVRGMSRAVQLLVGLRELGDAETLKRATDAASRAQKKFHAGTKDSSSPPTSAAASAPSFEPKFEKYETRCARIAKSLCCLIANRRYRAVVLRAVETDAAAASALTTDMFLAASELLIGSNSSSNTEKATATTTDSAVRTLHRLLFSMVLFVSSVKERSSNTLAILPQLFHRSNCIGRHVAKNLSPQSAQGQKQQRADKTSAIETLLELDNGEALLSALMKPVADTQGARAVVYYNSDAGAMQRHRISQAEWTTFDGLLSGSNSSACGSGGGGGGAKSPAAAAAAFPAEKQLQLLSALFSAFCGCDAADEYFQERKKALIRSELAAVFSKKTATATTAAKKKTPVAAAADAASDDIDAEAAAEAGTGTIDENAAAAAAAADGDDDDDDASSRRASSVATTVVSSSDGGGAASAANRSANIRVSLMCRVASRMAQIVRNAIENGAAAAGDTNNNNEGGGATSEGQQQEAATRVIRGFWSAVQHMFDALHRHRALNASDDLRYNNGRGFESLFRLVNSLLLEQLSTIVGGGSESAATAATASADGAAMMMSLLPTLFGGADADATAAASSSSVSTDSVFLGSLQDSLSALSSTLLDGDGSGGTFVLSVVCKCLTCVGRLAPTHLMRFLPAVVRSLARVNKKPSSVDQRELAQILELLCFAIEHLGKLNQCSSFLRSLLTEVSAAKQKKKKKKSGGKQSKKINLLFLVLRDPRLCDAVRGAAAETLDAETILSVCTEVSEAAITAVSAAAAAAAAAADQEEEEEQDDDDADAGASANNIRHMYPLAAAVIEGVTASPVSGLAVAEQLVAIDATMSFVASTVLSSSEIESGMLDALRLVTAARRKLFLVLQNAGVPSVDELLLSLNRASWKFPHSIGSLLLPRDEEEEEEADDDDDDDDSSNNKSPAARLARQIREHLPNEEADTVVTVFCQLACSHLRLAAVVSQLVVPASAGGAGFDIKTDARALGLAQCIVSELMSVSSAESFIEAQDFFLLRQLDPAGTAQLIGQQQHQWPVCGDVVSGTEQQWQSERGMVASSTKQSKRSNSKQQQQQPTDETALTLLQRVVTIMSSSPAPDTQFAMLLALRTFTKRYSSIGERPRQQQSQQQQQQQKQQKDQQQQHKVKKSELRAEIAQACNSISRALEKQQQVAATARVFIATMSFFVADGNDPSEQLLSSWAALLHPQQQQQQQQFFFGAIAAVAPIAVLKAATTIGRALESALDSIPTTNRAAANAAILASTTTILKELQNNGVSLSHFANQHLRAAQRLLEAVVVSVSSAASAASTSQLYSDGLWVCKTVLIGLSPRAALFSSLLVVVAFVDRALVFGRIHKSRVLIRRCCEALTLLYSESRSEDPTQQQQQQQQQPATTTAAASPSSRAAAAGDDDDATSASPARAAAASGMTNAARAAAAARSKAALESRRLHHLLHMHAPRFAFDILSVVAAPWMFSLTSCAETLLSLVAPVSATATATTTTTASPVSESDNAAAVASEHTSAAARSALLKMLCVDNAACTALHEMALTLVVLSQAQQGEGAERTAAAAAARSIKRTGATVTDANDFVFVSMTSSPEAQVRLKSLHLEAQERL